MPSTYHARAAEQFAIKTRQSDHGRAVLSSYRELIAEPEARPYVRAIGHPYSGWSDGQVAALAKVDALITAGAVRAMLIPVGAKPGRDRDREGNAHKLAEGLPPEFSATVHDGTDHDGDAELSWGTETLPTWHTCAPLEIGYTDASRTFLHLLDSGRVARWPYQSEDIWLIGFTSEDAWWSWRLDIVASGSLR